MNCGWVIFYMIKLLVMEDHYLHFTSPDTYTSYVAQLTYPMFLVKWSLRSGLSDSMNSSAELYTVHSCLPGGSRRGEGEEERREGKGGQRRREEGRKSEKEKKEGGVEREGREQ